MKTIVTIIAIVVACFACSVRSATTSLPTDVEAALTKIADPTTKYADAIEAVQVIAAADPADEDAIISRLNAALSLPSTHVREYAMAAVRKLGPGAVSTAPAIRATFRDPQFSATRGTAVLSLGMIKARDEESVSIIVTAIDDKDQGVREVATFAIAQIGAPAAAAVPRLMQMARSNEPMAWIGAIEALGSIGPAARDAMPEILNRFHHDDQSQVVAMRAMSRIAGDDPVVIEAICGNLNNPRPEVRKGALEAVGLIGHDAAAALPRVRELAKEEATKTPAAVALVQLGHSDEGLPILEQIALSKDVKLEDVESTISLGEPGVQILCKVIDQKAKATSWSIQALQRAGPTAKSALPSLQKIVDAGRTKENRYRYDAAIKAIHAIQKPSKTEG